MFTLELLNSDLMMTGEESPFEDLENLRISPPRLSSPVRATVAGGCSEIRRFFFKFRFKNFKCDLSFLLRSNRKLIIIHAFD